MFRPTPPFAPIHRNRFQRLFTSTDDSWMVQIENATIQWKSSSRKQRFSKHFFIPSMQINPSGGHAVLGCNGSGKSLLLNALTQPKEFITANGNSSFRHQNTDSLRPLTSRVSFESHQELLEKGGSVQATLGRHLTGTTQYLVVRFGLFHLLTRQVDTLSTGEIRKVLLIAAIAARPRILLLDNAFDGLDVESRAVLKDIVSKTIVGFRMDILVQGITTPLPMQVVLATHRAEEINDEISVVTTCRKKNSEAVFVTRERGEQTAAAMLAGATSDNNDNGVVNDCNQPWNDPNLPPRATLEKIAAERKLIVEKDETDPAPLIIVNDLSLIRGGKEVLSGISLTIKQGERWLVAGGNGAGKSTLSRLLAQAEGGIDSVDFDIRANDVGHVSTEKHMSTAHSTASVGDYLGNKSNSLRSLIVEWFEIQEFIDEERLMSELSQGEQKLVLIAEALIKQPKLLVFDEITQGLDLTRRRRVLGLVERWCVSTNTSLIYVTHHNEEILPCITHVLKLENNKGEASHR